MILNVNYFFPIFHVNLVHFFIFGDVGFLTGAVVPSLSLNFETAMNTEENEKKISTECPFGCKKFPTRKTNR